MDFKCYNCGKKLIKDHTSFRCSESDYYVGCVPYDYYYNTYIEFSENNKIIHYAFTSLINKKYYRIVGKESICETRIFFQNPFYDNRKTNSFLFESPVLINKYFPITFDYMNELPGLFDYLIKLSIFV
jgi:hypothetical protein